jgi:hypothetical protein
VVIDEGSTIQEVCSFSTSSQGTAGFNDVQDTTITATRLSSKSSESEITKKRPEQKFTPPRRSLTPSQRIKGFAR